MTDWVVITDEPVYMCERHLCTYVIEEGGDGESAGSEDLSLLSYTLRYVSLTDLDRLCQFGL